MHLTVQHMADPGWGILFNNPLFYLKSTPTAVEIIISLYMIFVFCVHSTIDGGKET